MTEPTAQPQNQPSRLPAAGSDAEPEPGAEPGADAATGDNRPAAGVTATPARRPDGDIEYDDLVALIERASRSKEGTPGDDGLLSWAGEVHAVTAGLALGFGMTTPNEALFVLASALLGFTALLDGKQKKQHVAENTARPTVRDPLAESQSATQAAAAEPNAEAWAAMRAEFSYAVAGFVIGATIGTIQTAYVGGRAAFGEWLGGLGYAEGVGAAADPVLHALSLLVYLPGV